MNIFKKDEDQKFYRTSQIKRSRRTKAQLEQLDRQILKVLRSDHPQSVRHIFYRMTDPRLSQPVEKSDRGYRQVQDRCVKLRRSGRLPYSWIADMSRSGYHVSTYADAADFISQVKGFYRGDLWATSNFCCEVWVESRSIGSVLIKDCQELAVSLYPCGGFSSVTFAYEAAKAHSYRDDAKPLVVLYIGDYDPAGVLIDKALERELRQHLRSDIELIFKRIGINDHHVEVYDLPTKPRKPGDNRSAHLHFTVEAEAMPAKILRNILRDEIEGLLPKNALEIIKVAERSELEHLTRISRVLRGPK